MERQSRKTNPRSGEPGTELTASGLCDLHLGSTGKPKGVMIEHRNPVGESAAA